MRKKPEETIKRNIFFRKGSFKNTRLPEWVGFLNFDGILSLAQGEFHLGLKEIHPREFEKSVMVSFFNLIEYRLRVEMKFS